MTYLLSLAASPSAWLALMTLIAMEIVLGVDNLIFIAILSNKLPESQRSRARRTGICLSLVLRVALVSTVALLTKLTTPLFDAMGHSFSWRDLIFIGGGFFLILKAVQEIHTNIKADHATANSLPKPRSFALAIFQILLLDLVFSIDSIITAVGMTEHIPIMIVSVIAAVLAMLFAADPLANFIHKHPRIIMLALGFLLMIGGALIVQGFGFDVSKSYIYSAMVFSAGVEGLNILRDRNHRYRPK
jgi:predicted tellurium resistance membrane protein TerC